METVIHELASVLRSSDKMADQFAQRVQERVGQPISHEEILAVMKKIAPTRLTIDIVVDKLRRQLQ